MTADRIVVVGASRAAGAFITQLRASEYAGEVIAIDPDPDAPYDRPPLSKEFLANQEHRPEALWWDERCTLIRGQAIGLDPAARQVRVATADHEINVSGDHIVIATGASPIVLPNEPAGILHFRSAADARALREQAARARHVIILGAGLIGTELASTLRELGLEVTLIDQAKAPMERFLGGQLGELVSTWITEAGVELLLGVKVEQVAPEGAEWVVTTSGPTVRGDLVVSVLGVRPEVAWLADSGLDISNGVLCDNHGTALDRHGEPVAGIHAIGDVSRWQSAETGGRRFEDWTTAQRQGRHLAEVLTGSEPKRPLGTELPYLWTQQFGRRVQVLGTIEPGHVAVRRVTDASGVALFYTFETVGEQADETGDSAPKAALAVNAPREFVGAMRGTFPPPA